MRDRRIWWLALAGTLGGVGTWLISEPFAYTAEQHGGRAGATAFSLGSFYGWFAHYMLGALIAGFLAFVMSLPRAGVLRSFLGALVAGCVGGALTCAADAFSDWVGMRFISGAGGVGGALGAGLLVTMMWHLLVAVSIAMSVAMASYPTPERTRRALLAGIGAAVASYFTRDILGTFDAMRTISQVDLSQLDPKNPDALLWTLEAWRPWSLQRLGSDISMGLVIGLALGFADTWMRAAWLRREVGRNEGSNFPLYNGPNRIGAAEGLEVSVRGEAGVAPVHAVLQPNQGMWAVGDVSGQGIRVNGHAVPSAYLQHGDVLQIGQATFRLFLDGPVPNAAPVAHAPYAPDPQPVTVLEAQPVVVDHRLIDPFGQVIPLAMGSQVVGRGADAQVRLDYDAAVSPQHALVLVAPAGATLRPLGGANQTEVNGQAIVNDTVLRNGDRVRFAGTEMRYRC